MKKEKVEKEDNDKKMTNNKSISVSLRDENKMAKKEMKTRRSVINCFNLNSQTPVQACLSEDKILMPK